MEHITCNAEIAIQGDRVLRFVNCTQERVVYDVIGFSEPSITIIDYRQVGLDAIFALLQIGEVIDFAPKFNGPVKVEFQRDNDGNILIELYEIENRQATHMLWIVVGIQDSVPVYDYLFEVIAPYQNDSFAFAALFSIPIVPVETNYDFDSDGFSGCV